MQLTTKKIIIAAAFMLSQFLATNTAHAGSVHFIDNGTYTTDTLSGLDWLDVNLSRNESYNYVSSQFGVGGDYEGWRYASVNEVNRMISNYTGIENTNTSNYNLPSDTYLTFSALVGLLGPTYVDETPPDPGSLSFIRGTTGDWDINTTYLSTVFLYSETREGQFYAGYVAQGSILPDEVNMEGTPDFNIGSFLVRNTLTTVPAPAAVWLMGTGILGLLGFSRKRNHSEV